MRALSVKQSVERDGICFFFLLLSSSFFFLWRRRVRMGLP